MINKDRYILTELSLIPRYKVNGCGKKITSAFDVDVFHMEHKVGTFRAKENILPYLMIWLEKEEEKP